MKSILALAALLCCTYTLAQSPEFTGSTADVVAWNFSGFNPIPSDRQTEIARVLNDLDAELAAVVEINPDNVVRNSSPASQERMM